MRALGRPGAGKIEHVVYIVQENRSFNNCSGFPGADTVSSGKDPWETIQLQPVSLEESLRNRPLGQSDVRGLRRQRASCPARSAG